MNEGGRILFVDDDASLRTVVSIALTKDGHSVETAENGEVALTKFAAGGFDLVIQDVRMPGMDGLELLARLKAADPAVPVVVMTAYSTWDVAVEAMRLGAFDYLKKPFDNNDLRLLARRAINYRTAAALSPDDEDSAATVRIIGSSPPMQEIQEVISRIARNDSTVLVEGESGTGKELVAAMVHAQSPRRLGPFIAVNCGGFSETLLESELFGHVKGSFTGAVADKKGLLDLADGGTFFLDELGETTLSTQVRLLRVLETKTFLPVGGEVPHKTDVRFVAATNRNLLEMVEAGSFRQDLYYRLNVIAIKVPPLRERQEDVPMLAGYFLSLYASRFNKPITGFDPAAMDAMLAYKWPGNVRELQNAVQRAVSLAEGEYVHFADIFPSWATQRSEPPPPAPPGSVEERRGGVAKAGANPLPALTDTGFDLEKTLSDIESNYISEAIERCHGNLTQAAEMLGITFRSIRYKVKKLDVEK